MSRILKQRLVFTIDDIVRIYLIYSINKFFVVSPFGSPRSFISLNDAISYGYSLLDEHSFHMKGCD